MNSSNTDTSFKRSNKIQHSPIKTTIKEVPGNKLPKPIKIKIETEDTEDIQLTKTQSPIILKNLETENTDEADTRFTEIQTPIIVERSENRIATAPKHIPLTQENNLQKMAQKIATEIFSLVMNSLPEFRGNDSENTCSDLRNFITKAEWTRTHMVEVDKHEIFDQVLLFKLTGDAQRKTQTKDIKNFNELKEVLNRLYATPESLQELRSKFFNCIQKQGESTNEYGQRLTNAMEIYMLGFETKYESKLDAANLSDLTEQALSIFKKGLQNTQLKIQLIPTRKETLEELINEAIAIEKLISDAEKWNEVSSPQIQIQPRFTRQPRILQQTSPTYIHQPVCNEQKFLQQPQNLTKPAYNSSKQNCHYCDKPGHIWQECRSYSHDQANRTPKITQNNTFKHCNYCKRTGHDINECRTKKYNDERHQNFNRNYQGQASFNPRNNFSRSINQDQQYRNQQPKMNPSQQQQSYNNQQQRPHYNSPPKQPFFQRYQPPDNRTTDNWRQNPSNNTNRFNNQPAIDELSNEIGKMKIFTTDQVKNSGNEISENFNGSDKRL